ncbi:universal stress protein [Limnothrix sp. FACHB-881]|uniref:universal stress protein n=1 Tax=Limnothrix sp. FACHB-881 TaxID=2692819 RepID=UPI0016881D94|nr:universal stress protein [Limnothrix sp. FACHB-881]MBD2635698.1 universal stress protein [Limnothrix sp. FACHB-881]
MHIPKRGKHKVFIGMAPGVGKTYRMLEEGQQLKAEGVDVVIGLLETHGRKETADKAIGLEVVPPAQIAYQNRLLPEMDVAAICDRQPQLVLIDELAHTNVPTSDRPKRYQDVELILGAGIDVFSTLNIQHLESLNDLVTQITGVVIRERVPDRILEEANEVVVIDVTPETLEERLQDGKVYALDKIPQALTNFFQRRHLIALRELALREVADNVEEQAIDQDPSTPFCNIHERVLVCVSTYEGSMRLLRRAARLASYMNAPLYGLFVCPPDRFLSKSEALQIEGCQRLCEEFGGEFLQVQASNIPQEIAKVARDYRITQIVLGETRRSRWQLLLRGSLTYRLMNLLTEQSVDLHIMSHDSRAPRSQNSAES